MIIESRSADPAVHELCIRIARACLAVISPLLRQEERNEALREFYIAARAEMDKPTPEPEV